METNDVDWWKSEPAFLEWWAENKHKVEHLRNCNHDELYDMVIHWMWVFEHFEKANQEIIESRREA